MKSVILVRTFHLCTPPHTGRCLIFILRREKEKAWQNENDSASSTEPIRLATSNNAIRRSQPN